jgi:hypothetical protein
MRKLRKTLRSAGTPKKTVAKKTVGRHNSHRHSRPEVHGGPGMTDQDLVLSAMEEAQSILAEYVDPRAAFVAPISQSTGFS